MTLEGILLNFGLYEKKYIYNTTNIKKINKQINKSTKVVLNIICVL